MGRLEKLKRQVIEESNKRVLKEEISFITPKGDTWTTPEDYYNPEDKGVYDPESEFEYDEEVLNIFHDITRYFNERTENIDFVQYRELSKKLGRWFLGGM